MEFTGQIVKIEVWSSGYWASIVTETEDGGVSKINKTASIPLTVKQANALKEGDMVSFTIIFDGWGCLDHVEEIHKNPKSPWKD